MKVKIVILYYFRSHEADTTSFYPVQCKIDNNHIKYNVRLCGTRNLTFKFVLCENFIDKFLVLQ